MHIIDYRTAFNIPTFNFRGIWYKIKLRENFIAHNTDELNFICFAFCFCFLSFVTRFHFLHKQNQIGKDGESYILHVADHEAVKLCLGTNLIFKEHIKKYPKKEEHQQ